jgi:1-acyl-sn-glycerol-3-phosphate acyltransferase
MAFNPYYYCIVSSVRLYARLMLKLDVCWHEPFPAGAKLLAANHPSATDPFVIHLLMREHLSVFISANAFAMPLFGAYLRLCEQIPVAAEQGRDALDEGRRRLKAGRAVGIFPEGLVSPESGYHQPRKGTARLALETGAPIIPIGIYLPRDCRTRLSSELSGKHAEALWYLRGPYFITVGEAIKFSGNADDKNLVNEITNQIMEKIDVLAQESQCRAEAKLTLKNI